MVRAARMRLSTHPARAGRRTPRGVRVAHRGEDDVGQRARYGPRVQSMWRRGRHGSIGRDGVVAVALAAILLGCAALDDKGPPIQAWHGAIALATTAPLAVRSRWPLPVLAAVLAGTFASLATFDPNMTVALPVMLALYTAALASDRRMTLILAVAVVPVTILMVWQFSPGGVVDVETLKNLGLALLPLALGSAKRDHHAYIAAVEERAERAERTREEEALRRVGEERLRIARELHDVVAHAMVAINVQAGVAAHLIDRQPDSARGALQQIKQVSGEALTDLRATLGVLRSGDDGPAPTRPAQGIAALEELAERVRAAGVEVNIELSGRRCTVPSAIEAALFRTVQEALTNVLRHSASREATVRLEVREASARVEVLDDGPCQAAAVPAGNGSPVAEGSGNGLRGMRERIAAHGGMVEAGPRPDGGWRVQALLPLPPEAA
jgi:signal transduction histidine kinase